jgi:hypothetical protein
VSVQLNNYLKDEDVRLIANKSDLRSSFLEGVSESDPSLPCEDIAGALEKGWQWLFESARANQPKFYAALNNSSARVIALEKKVVDVFSNDFAYITEVFLQTEHALIKFCPWMYPGEFDFVTEPDHVLSRLYNSLPHQIASSYYLRIDGMSLMNEDFFDELYMKGMPASLTAPASAHDYTLVNNKKSVHEVLLNVVDKNVSGRKELQNDFRVLLDTRIDGDDSISGDLLIYQAHSKSQRIFHVPGMNFHKIRLLNSPSDALDEYTSAVLVGRDANFDFLPYGEACV